MNSVDVMVGQRIRARRTALGMSQTELGRRIGVKFQQVQKYESGQNRVSASRLWSIAEALEVPVVHFFEQLPVNSTAGQDHADFLSDSRAVRLVSDFLRLPEGQKKAVLDIVASMAHREPSEKEAAHFGA